MRALSNNTDTAPIADDGDRPGPRLPAFMIVGTGRCGSTLLQAMLSAHPQIRIPYETKFFFQLDPVALGFDDPIAVDEVERYLEQAQKHCSMGVLEADPELFEAYRQAVRDGMRDGQSMLAWIVSLGEDLDTNTIVGEKTPGHWMKTKRIFDLNPSCKLIHLVRDPRDVTESLTRMSWWPTDSTYITAKHCKKTIAACMEQDKAIGPDQHLWIRFEDLLHDPRTTLTRVCKYLDVEFDEQMIERQEASQKNLNPNNDAWMAGSMQEIDPGRRGKYRETLSRADIGLIESVVGTKLMKSAGYTPESSRPTQAVAMFNRMCSAGTRFVYKQITSIRNIFYRS